MTGQTPRGGGRQSFLSPQEANNAGPCRIQTHFGPVLVSCRGQERARIREPRITWPPILGTRRPRHGTIRSSSSGGSRALADSRSCHACREARCHYWSHITTGTERAARMRTPTGVLSRRRTGGASFSTDGNGGNVSLELAVVTARWSIDMKSLPSLGLLFCPRNGRRFKRRHASYLLRTPSMTALYTMAAISARVTSFVAQRDSVPSSSSTP